MLGATVFGLVKALGASSMVQNLTCVLKQHTRFAARTNCRTHSPVVCVTLHRLTLHRRLSLETLLLPPYSGKIDDMCF